MQRFRMPSCCKNATIDMKDDILTSFFDTPDMEIWSNGATEMCGGADGRMVDGVGTLSVAPT